MCGGGGKVQRNAVGKQWKGLGGLKRATVSRGGGGVDGGRESVYLKKRRLRKTLVA